MSNSRSIFRYFAFAVVVLTCGIGLFVYTAKQAESDQPEPLSPPAAMQPLKIPPPLTTPPAHIKFQKQNIQLLKQDGETLDFNIELAITPDQQTQGLMFRTEMAENTGMLFLFNVEVVLSFWMKNTLIPLDMLFLGPDGKIVHIHENAQPQDLTPISSQVPAKAVLELNAGAASKMGIQIGDQVLHDFFGNIKAEK